MIFHNNKSLRMYARIWIWPAKEMFEGAWIEILSQQSAPGRVPVSISAKKIQLLIFFMSYVFK